LKLEKVGYLEHPAVLPLAGNDTFETNNKGTVTLALEVFQLASSGLTILQQRSPVIRQFNAQFASCLAAWIKQHNFRNVLYLASCEGSMRHDSQLQGSQLRVLSNTSMEHNPNNWEVLEQRSQSQVLKRGTVLTNFWNVASEKNIWCTLLVIFCSEGNNIPESLVLIEHVAKHLKLPQVPWILPPSLQVVNEEFVFTDEMYI